MKETKKKKLLEIYLNAEELSVLKGGYIKAHNLNGFFQCNCDYNNSATSANTNTHKTCTCTCI